MRNLLADCVTIEHALEQREETSDRRLALTHNLQSLPPLELLRRWAQLKLSGSENPGATVNRAKAITTLGLVGVGVGLGWLLASGIFAYDGSRPVNLLLVLLVLVLIPNFFLLGTLLAMLPVNVPLLQKLQEIVLRYNPGNLLVSILRLLPQHLRERFELFLAKSRRSSTVYGRLRKWLLLQAGQIVAVSVYLGAVLRAFQLVVFSDLAFTWSTTLDISSATVHQLLTALSFPWQGYLPSAVPTLELVETSKYYRLGEQVHASPAVLGQWWAFLLTAITLYGFLPRLMLLLLSSWQLQRATARTILTLPGASEAVLSMKLAQVELVDEAVSDQPPPVTITDQQPTASLPIGPASIISWNAEPVSILIDYLKRYGITAQRTYSAGATVAPEAEASTVADLGVTPEGIAIIVVAKDWEPPAADLFDFLTQLRKSVDHRIVYLLPLPPEAYGYSARAVADQQLHVWQRSIAKSADPWLRLGEANSNDSA